MRNALAIAVLFAAAPAAAEPVAARGYLSWPGKTPAPAPQPIAAPPLAPAPAAAAIAPQTAPAAPQDTAQAALEIETPRRADGPRRYSVHRDFGQAPDRTELPAEFFLDAPPVDLAEPPPQPLSERDERRLRAQAASPDSPQ